MVKNIELPEDVSSLANERLVSLSFKCLIRDRKISDLESLFSEGEKLSLALEVENLLRLISELSKEELLRRAKEIKVKVAFQFFS